MEKQSTAAGESIIGPAICSTQSETINYGPLVIEVIQYDDEYRFGCAEVVTFDISSWSADRFRQFWEFIHTPELCRP
jgi:hypothetical protein